VVDVHPVLVVGMMVDFGRLLRPVFQLLLALPPLQTPDDRKNILVWLLRALRILGTLGGSGLLHSDGFCLLRLRLEPRFWFRFWFFRLRLVAGHEGKFIVLWHGGRWEVWERRVWIELGGQRREVEVVVGGRGLGLDRLVIEVEFTIWEIGEAG
jgi:hypothetical protein